MLDLLQEAFLDGLIVIHSPHLFDALAQLLHGLPAVAHWREQLTCDDLQQVIQLRPAFVLADPFALHFDPQSDLVCALRENLGSTPLVALLPADTRASREAAFKLGANAILDLENVDRELLPLLRKLLRRNRLAKGIAGHLQAAAWSNAPFGETAQLGERPPDDLAALSAAAVDRMLPTLPEPVLPAPSPPSAGERPSSQSPVFLKSLAFEASAGADGRCDHTFRTACNLNCGNHFCGLQVSVRGGSVCQIEPAEFPDPRYKRLCLKGISHLQTVAHPDRLLTPLKRRGPRGAGDWERISWEQALDEIAARARLIQHTYGPRAFMFFPYSGQLSALNGIAGVYLRLASLWGASGTNLLEFGVDSAVPSGIEDTLGAGSGYLANDYSDLSNTRTLVIWGANPVYSRMNWWQFFTEAQSAGCRLITIDPKFSATAAKSDAWLPIRPGTDLYLALALVNHLIRQELYDRDFLRAHTAAPLLVDKASGRYLRLPDRRQPGAPMVFAVLDPHTGKPAPLGSVAQPALAGSCRQGGKTCCTSFSLLAEMAEPYTTQFAADKTGLEAAQIVALAAALSSAKPARIYTLYGIDRWHHGAAFGRLIAVLAALTGNLGQPGAGAGVDGFSRGVLQTTPSFIYPDGRQYAPVNAAELPDHILQGDPYPVRGVFTAFNNWLNQWPDRSHLENEILPALDLLVCADLFMTETARYADYVLPAAHLFEREDLVHGPAPYVQYQPALLKPPGECRSDFDIAAELARRFGYGDYFADPPRVYLQQILEADPSTAGISIAQLASAGVLPRRLESYSSVAHSKYRFNTPTGRVEFYVERLAPYGHALPVYEPPVEANLESSLAQRFPFVCITEHSRYRVHSTFVNTPWLRELEREPLVLIHPVPAAARQIKDGDLVKLFNDRGYVVMKARLNRAVHPETVYVTQGWQSRDYVAGHIQALTHSQSNPLNVMGANTSFSDVLVEVCRQLPNECVEAAAASTSHQEQIT